MSESVPAHVQLYVDREVRKAKGQAMLVNGFVVAAVSALATLGIWQGVIRYADEHVKKAVEEQVTARAVREVRAEIEALRENLDRVDKVFKDLGGLIEVPIPVLVPGPEPPSVDPPRPLEVRDDATTDEQLQAIMLYIVELRQYSETLERILDVYRTYARKGALLSGTSVAPRSEGK